MEKIFASKINSRCIYLLRIFISHLFRIVRFLLQDEDFSMAFHALAFSVEPRPCEGKEEGEKVLCEKRMKKQSNVFPPKKILL